MKLFYLFFIAFLISCSSKKSMLSNVENEKPSEEINKHNSIKHLKLGADNYDLYLKLLQNKNVGIVTNQSGILSNKTHLVDFLIEKNISVIKIFAPEHGFRGVADAGELIKDAKDSKTNLPIISLYGNNKKPTESQLNGLDIIVFDIQDVGVRFYTYISTLHYIMEACAEFNVPLLVLDRPNPNISIIDGPILEKDFSSFVGLHPVPILHGLTIGEYAKMINGEKWLKDNLTCNLTIIACEGYSRDTKYSLPVRPSPNLPNDKAINFYASLCLFEGTSVSVGRGTDKQFQIYGSPFLQYHNFTFTPKPNLGAKNPLYNGVLCYGEDLSNHENLNRLELNWLIKAYKTSSDGEKFFTSFFNKLAGNATLKAQIESGLSETEIRNSWKDGIENFKRRREPYLLYH